MFTSTFVHNLHFYLTVFKLKTESLVKSGLSLLDLSHMVANCSWDHCYNFSGFIVDSLKGHVYACSAIMFRNKFPGNIFVNQNTKKFANDSHLRVHNILVLRAGWKMLMISAEMFSYYKQQPRGATYWKIFIWLDLSPLRDCICCYVCCQWYS